MQCKDIDSDKIIMWLHKNTTHEKYATHGRGFGMPTIKDCMPKETPIKLQLAKMAMLIKRGLVEGCICGCMGDFRLTVNGEEYAERLEV